MKKMKDKAQHAAEFVKSFANPSRLMVLCALAEKEQSVTQLLQHVPIGQTALSQHLARLRREGLIAFRRQHTTLHYRLKDARVKKMVALLAAMFCN